MSYTRKWVCKSCGKDQKSIDYPKIEVCYYCVASNPRVKHHRNMVKFHTLKINEATDEFLRDYK